MLVIELDTHGASAPQVIGTLMAAAAMPPTARAIAFRAVDAARARPGVLPEGVIVRRLLQGVPGAAPPLPGQPAAGPPDDRWRGIPAEQRWAMEVLGVRAGARVDRTDVQQRFRRLLRLAHPDQGAASKGAAERIAELREARALLLDVLARPRGRSAGKSASEAAPA
jgi:hypothetical protein